MSSEVLEKKLDALKTALAALPAATIAFSGGVDSTFLAAAALRWIKGNVIAVTAFSPTLSKSEHAEAERIAREIGIKHLFMTADEMSDESFCANTPDRCYHCKKLRFGALVKWTLENGYHCVLEGSNADDTSDHRPGMRAVAELSDVHSPLLDLKFSKEEIRLISKRWSLPTWNKPSSACLASRIPYGVRITSEVLLQVEKAERFVRRHISGQVRVRHHGNIARIEVESAQMAILTRPEVSAAILKELKSIGFSYVALDLNGYRMGSLNDVISHHDRGNI